MKKNVQLILSMAMIIWCTLNLNAQINFEGASDYGRIYDLTYDLNIENRVYAVTLGNHLILSEDNGQNWEVIYSFPVSGSNITGLRTVGDDLLSFYVRFSANPTENTIYLFDTTTNEISKQYTPPVSAGATKEWVSAYSIYEADTDIMLFNQDYKIGQANYSKVYYTVDGGSSWEEVYYNEDFDSVFPNNVAISPNNPDKFFIARSNGPTSVDGGLMVSVDAGATWVNKIPDHLFNEITFNPENPDIILTGTFGGASTENIYKSEDGGDTWGIMPIDWDDYFLDSITHIAYNPNDVDNIMVLEGNEIAITIDGGSTWDNYIYEESAISYFYGLKASFNPFQAGEVLISTDFYPVRSTDGGITVSQIENSLFNATQVGISAGGEGHLYYSVQRGIVHKNLTTMEETPYYVDPVNYFYSTDPPKYTIDPTLEGRIYMFVDGFNGQSLYVSDDHGASLTYLKQTWFDQFYHVATDPNNSNIVWASYNSSGTLMIDFTNSPVTTTVNMPTNNDHLSTLIDPSDSNNVLVGLGGEVYQTLDLGSTWANVSTGLNLDSQYDRIYSIKQNPFSNSEYILATSQGVFQSVDGAQNWTQVYIGNNVRNIEYSTIVEGQIAASIPTAEFVQAQVIYSMDNGVEWNVVSSEEIANVGSTSMDFTFQENSITTYLATYDLGVITYEIDTAINDTPPNDLCDGATVISCGDSISGDTSNATNNDGIPVCGSTTLDSAPGLWYTLTIPNDGDYDVTIDTFGSAFDTKLGIFSGDCNALICVTSNDDTGGTQSEVMFVGTSGESYYVYITGWSTSAGEFDLNVACEEVVSAPDNDLCQDAIAVECGDSVSGDTTNATNTGNPGTCDTDLTVGPGVWYTLTIPNDGNYEVTVNTIGSEFDTKLGIFSGACGASVCVAGNDDIGGGVLQSEVTFEGTSGETYNIYITGFLTNAGLYNLNVDCDLILGEIDNVIVGFSYYPNPTSDVINLNAQQNIEKVSIYNILGQKVVDQNNNAMSTQINVADLTSGTYIMKVLVNDKTGTYKIVKE